MSTPPWDDAPAAPPAPADPVREGMLRARQLARRGMREAAEKPAADRPAPTVQHHDAPEGR